MKIRNRPFVPARTYHLPSWLTILAVAVVFAAGTPAQAAKGGAAKGPVKVAVPNFTGPGEAATRGAVIKALQSKKVIIVSGADLQAAAKKQHVKLEDDAGYKAVSESLGLTAVVLGELSKKKATLTLRSGEDGTVVDEVTFVGADPHKLAAVVSRTFWKRTASGFRKTRPPGSGGTSALAQQAESAAKEPEPAAEPEPAEDSKEDSKPSPQAANKKKASPTAEAKKEEGDKGKSEASDEKPSDSSDEGSSGGDEALDVAVGFSDLMRSLTYNQARPDLSPNSPATYSLPKSPNLIAHVDFFPLALSSTDFLSKVGLTVDLGYLLPVVTSPSVGGSYKTAALAWSAGLKVRLPYNLYVLAAYGDQWFKLTRANSSMDASRVPGTDYKFARIGVGIRRQVMPALNLMAAVGYDHCLSSGQIGSSAYFPKATCAAAEASAGIGYKVTPSIEVRAGVDWRRYGLAFHVIPTDVDMNRPIAGGGLDQYTQFYLAVAYLMGGQSAEAGEGASAKKSSGDAEKSDDDDDDDDEKTEGK